MNSVGKGQTQVLTAVLLGGILIAGVTSAVVWGLPLLQKNQDISNAKTSLDNLRTVAEGVSTVAQQGGSRSTSMNLNDGSIVIDTENDTITFRTLTQGAYVSTTRWVPLNENDLQGVNRTTGLPTDGYGIQGRDKPVLVIGRATSTGDEYATTYRVIFRKLWNPNTGQTFQIDLRQDGNLRASGGGRTVRYQQLRESTNVTGGVNDGPITRNLVLISIS